MGEAHDGASGADVTTWHGQLRARDVTSWRTSQLGGGASPRGSHAAAAAERGPAAPGLRVPAGLVRAAGVLHGEPEPRRPPPGDAPSPRPTPPTTTG